ncbi:serine/threonine-protein kinase [Nocardia sp. SSK8]|uniref:serine/threonine-protein kinase n=1 Tax=Nocardia sp. SSK8 TaxID=3120154 RepID=UPI00300AA129
MIEPLSPTESPVIGRYRIRGVLGAGGMGRVLLATGPDGRFVAIKQIHAHLLDDREFRARFEREVAISARVSGAFTAAVVDFDTASESPWLASVFIPGVPLDKAVRELGPLPVPALRTLASGLASALHSIHSAGLVHRDLKPANVILAADGPRVIDFGIAQAAGLGSAPLTEVGAVVGSPAYMSPEQANSAPVTSASDVFSLGSLLCMAATGDSPFAATSAPYTLFNIVHSEPQLDAVPPPLRELIAGCLRKDPQARPTPAQILDYLGVLPVQAQPWPAPVHAEIAEQTRNLVALTSDPEATQILPPSLTIPRPSSAAVPPASPVPKRRTGLRLAIAATAAVVLAGALTAVVLRGDDDPPPPAVATAALPALDRLRGIDTCDWLRDALGETLPAAVAAKAATSVDAWRWQPTSSWGCDSSSGGARLAVEIGAATDLFDDEAGVVNGYVITRRGTDCAFAIAGPDAQPWGITVDTFTRDDCALAEHTVDRLTSAVTGLTPGPDAQASLSSVDPCALIDDSAFLSLGTATAKSAHVCEWPGATSVRVTLSQPQQRQSSVEEKVIDIGDGVLVEDEIIGSVGFNECRRVYRFRKIGTTYREVVEVFVADPKRTSGDLCQVADPLMRQAVSRLPAR